MGCMMNGSKTADPEGDCVEAGEEELNHQAVIILDIYAPSRVIFFLMTPNLDAGKRFY